MIIFINNKSTKFCQIITLHIKRFIHKRKAEQTIATCKRKFLNKFSVINNSLCHAFVVNAKKELESCRVEDGGRSATSR